MLVSRQCPKMSFSVPKCSPPVLASFVENVLLALMLVFNKSEKFLLSVSLRQGVTIKMRVRHYGLMTCNVHTIGQRIDDIVIQVLLKVFKNRTISVNFGSFLFNRFNILSPVYMDVLK